MLKVQEVVRSIPEAGWQRGYSVCYRDVSFTRTLQKIRFKFDCVKPVVGKRELDSNTVTGNKILKALKKEGHKIELVLVFDREILVYQEFPITMVGAV